MKNDDDFEKFIRERIEARLNESIKKAGEIEIVVSQRDWWRVLELLYEEEIGAYKEYKINYDILPNLNRKTLIKIRDKIKDMLLFYRDFYSKDLPGVILDDEIWGKYWGNPGFYDFRTEERLRSDVRVLNSVIIEKTKQEKF
jgi:hypothetical protein